MQAHEALGIENPNEVKSVEALPTLYGKKNSNGKIKQWTVGWIHQSDGTAILRRRHGQVGGKLKNSDKRTSAVNIGKKNERTPLAQAEFEAKAAFKKQLDVGMQATIEAAQSYQPTLPMLVQTYKENKDKITFPAYLQPKLNGVRCLADCRNGKDPSYISRKNKRYNGTVSHLTPYLTKAGSSDTTWDGEIYNHDWSFSKILQRVKKKRPDSDQLQYWIYDVADEKLTFGERHKFINQTLNNDGPIVIVPTIEVKSDAEIWAVHDEWVKLGFEGAIVRNKEGMYQRGLVRSYDVMRVKNFHDDEFEIIGGKAEEVQIEETGEWKNCVIFECKTADGKLFFARPRGSIQERSDMFYDLPNLIGKKLTVRYAEFSDDGLPIMPVGCAIRDYE